VESTPKAYRLEASNAAPSISTMTGTSPQAEPFRVIEAARFGFVFEFLKSLGQAMKTEGVQLFECRMSKH
jgi:hypothetical protein